MDAFVASGALKGMVDYEFPVVLGRAYAGAVERVGGSVARRTLPDSCFPTPATTGIIAGARTTATVIVPITEGKLDLGPWQAIFYVEFDGLRSKRLVIKAIGE